MGTLIGLDNSSNDHEWQIGTHPAGISSCDRLPFRKYANPRPMARNLSAARHRYTTDVQRDDRSVFFSRQLTVRKRDLNRHAIFVAYRPRDVTLAGDVFDEIDAAGAHQDLFATRYFQLAVAAERDDVLAPGCRVPVGDTSGRRATKLRTAIRQQLIGTGFAERSEFGLDFLDMRLAVRARIEPVDHDGLVRAIFGALRDFTGNYVVAFLTAAAAQVVAAGVIVYGRRLS